MQEAELESKLELPQIPDRFYKSAKVVPVREDRLLLLRNGQLVVQSFVQQFLIS